MQTNTKKEAIKINKRERTAKTGKRRVVGWEVVVVVVVMGAHLVSFNKDREVIKTPTKDLRSRDNCTGTNLNVFF